MPSDALLLTVQAVIPATPTTRIVRLDLGERAVRLRSRSGGAHRARGIRKPGFPYSIASAPIEAFENGWLDFLIKVEPSGRWGHQFDSVSPGMQLGVQGPFGSFMFPVQPPERHFLFIAGGTGIAPIRAMIRQALLKGQQGRMRLLYSAKTADDFAYLPELGEMAANDGLDLRLHVTREAPDTWQGERGRIKPSQLAPLIDDAGPRSASSAVPETMVAEVPRVLMELGIDRARVRLEEW